jgi:prepilin-type N-terminal cleavage/methylation domain-containing protein
MQQRRDTVRRQQSGFTLVEIAIVLVIIGLLLGGVLKGQELINSAKVKNFANDFRNISTFVYAYQDRFRATPGDDPAAAAHVVGANASTPAGLQGNARINGDWNSATQTDESYLFWQHVRLAGLATGATVVGAADYAPRNADGGQIGITSDPVIVGGTWAGSFFICSTGIQGRFARQLDVTIDDGNTTTGSVRVIALGVAATVTQAAFGALVNLTPADDANNYTVCVAN